MDEAVDLLLITWNRRQYVEKMLPQLLADPADFRLYCWDNASTDGTADIVASLDDPRVVRREFSKENVNQRPPFLWFLDSARSDVIGKVDDDVLLPTGWTERIAPLVRTDPRFGMLGCWTFMPDDWIEATAARNILNLESSRVFRAVSVAGCSFLACRNTLRRYIASPRHYGLPIDRLKMSVDGLISGYPLPIYYAHHMDDPRSPHNCYTRLGGGIQTRSALTARTLGFASAEEYATWIAADARHQQDTRFDRQLREWLLRADAGLWGRVRRRINRLVSWA